jgi:hypothetical protein
MFFKLIFPVALILYSQFSFSQEQRLADHNNIGWLVYTGTFKLKNKISLHTEYQWRRVNSLKNWQQGLLRTGVNFAIRKDVSLNAGYAFAETFPYGDYPATTVFPEHRIFEQVVIKNPVGKMDISHRFTLEQRFVGKVVIQNGSKETDFTFLNRMRYRLRSEIPFNSSKQGKNVWSIALLDEIFIGWGKNIGANIFDQNRLAVLIGYKINQNLKFEAGFLNQVLQQGKRVNDKPVFQYNNGFMMASHLSFDLAKQHIK